MIVYGWAFFMDREESTLCQKSFKLVFTPKFYQLCPCSCCPAAEAACWRKGTNMWQGAENWMCTDVRSAKAETVRLMTHLTAIKMTRKAHFSNLAVPQLITSLKCKHRHSLISAKAFTATFEGAERERFLI